MKFNFRKIASVLTSTVMLSSTLALAAAANYPAPFVKNGASDVAVVYGQISANSDLVAASDITQSLQLELAKQTAPSSGKSTSSTTVSGADFVTLSKPSNNLNLRDQVSGVFGSTVTDDDLSELLADGTYSNDENSDFDFEQKITLGSGLILNYFQDSDYNDRETAIGINLTTGQVLLNYTLDFTSDAESDVSSGDLVDLETTNINILGKQYYISDAKNSSLDITLLDTANSAVVAEGETKSVSVGDKTYEVMIDSISGSADSPRVKISVNGELSNQLSEGSTYKLKDGTYLGIKDVSIRDVAGTIGKVEFSLGSGKLKLRNGQSVEINDDSVSAVTSEIVRGSASSGKEKIDRINLVWTAQEDTFITPSTELVLPGFENIKFSMGKFTTPSAETTEVESGASDYIQLHTSIKDGTVSVPLLYANASGEFVGIGKSSSEKLVTSSAISSVLYNYTANDRMMVASYNTSNDAESYLVRFTGFINDNGVNKTDIEKNVGGSWQEVCDERKAGDTCTMGSLTLTINSISAYPDRTVNVSGNAGSSFNTLYTKEGLKVALPYGTATTNTSVTFSDGQISLNGTDANMISAGHGYDSFFLFFTEENKNEDIGVGNKFNVTLNDNSDGEVEASGINTGRTSFTDVDDNNHVMSRVYSDLASLVELDGQSSDQRHATITYNGGESFADLILTAKAGVVNTDGSNSTSTTTGNGVKDIGSVFVSDAEVSSVSSKNLIVVGGSCVNSVAAKLLGGSLCGADFTAKTEVGTGSFLIQSYTSPYASNKIAVLVAGYNAADTTNAAKYLTTQKVDVEKVSTKYKGTSATQASMVTATSATNVSK